MVIMKYIEEIPKAKKEGSQKIKGGQSIYPWWLFLVDQFKGTYEIPSVDSWKYFAIRVEILLSCCDRKELVKLNY